MNLNNKVVIITGGGSGIGKATALMLSRFNLKVIICGRKAELLNETVKIIESENGSCLGISVDITNEKQVANMMDYVIQKYGEINILINNAGVLYTNTIKHTSEEAFNTILDTNLKGTFFTCKYFLNSIKEPQDGIIINISSILGQKGIANYGAYCASKFGVIGLTQALSDELKHTNIRCYTICPGPTNTAMYQSVVGLEKANLAMRPEEIAKAILEIITNKTKASLGETLTIDKYKTNNLIEFYNKILAYLSTRHVNLPKIVTKYIMNSLNKK